MSEENKSNKSNVSNIASMQKAIKMSKNVTKSSKVVASGNPYVIGTMLAWENKEKILYIGIISLIVFLAPIIYIQNTIRNLPTIIWENVTSIFGDSEVTLSEVLGNIENLENITIEFLEDKQEEKILEIDSDYEVEIVEITNDMINIISLISKYSAISSNDKDLSSKKYKKFLYSIDYEFFTYQVIDNSKYKITYLDDAFDKAFNLTYDEQLLANQYELALSNYLYGIGNGDDIVQVAYTQVNTNRGGFMYKSWYGMDSSVAWCAIFVSWCANQCDYINQGIVPRFASCERGKEWFIKNNLWVYESATYTPKAGDIVFFEWGDGGYLDHVGIVTGADENFVYTIEGNTGGDSNTTSYVLERSRSRSNGTIVGYGIPLYSTNENTPD